MLERIKVLHNVGRFEKFAPDVDNPELTDFKPLTLVYSENGRGKTTVSALLRSLSLNDPRFVNERYRLSAESPLRVVLTVSGIDHAFTETGWTGGQPTIHVYDEHFVDSNVYSGCTVDSSHRKQLHVLVVGEDGVSLQNSVQELTTKIADLQTEVRKKTNIFSSDILGALTVDQFCAVMPESDLDESIAEAQQGVDVLSDVAAVETEKSFDSFAFPTLDLEAIEQLFEKTLPGVQQDAFDSVEEHLGSLGEGGESWVSTGVTYSQDRSDCPFCAQDLKSSPILAHYQAFFSEAYESHKEAIVTLQKTIQSSLSGDRLADLQQRLSDARRLVEFWSKYAEVRAFDLETENLSSLWRTARDRLIDLIEKKAQSPLEQFSLDNEDRLAVSAYHDLSVKALELSAALLECNDSVKLAKEKAKSGDLATAKAHLARLEASQRRGDPETNKQCREYIDARAAKAKAEEEKRAAHSSLTNYRSTVFPKYENTINVYLQRFHADFTISSLKPTDPRGDPSSDWGLVVNKTCVSLRDDPHNPEPSFRTALSSGDKNTLALAFFFASLEVSPALADSIVVIDDPVSSLDDGRTVATVQQIRKLRDRVKQLILLSHSKPLLCETWDNAKKRDRARKEDTVAALRICDAGPDASILTAWDVTDASKTEYDRKHALLRSYVSESNGEPRDVAVSLRPLLEGFLRVACVESFPPGTLIGDFIHRAKQVTPRPLSDSALETLDDLRDYANRFHHDSSADYVQNLGDLTETELKGFATKVLAFTRAP